jgi:hypothetical protein
MRGSVPPVPNPPTGTPVSAAVRLLAEAEAAGISLDLDAHGTVRLGADTQPPPPLLAGLREHRHEVVALLRGDRCRYCGLPVNWRAYDNLVFADGSGAHLGCYERAETERQATGRAADDRR